MLFMLIGSTLGGYIPTLFGVDSLSFTSILGSVIGGLFGIWLANRLFD